MPPKQEQRSLKPAKKGQSPSKDQNSRRRQPSGRISAACEACKKRKTKCSGDPPPCTMCEQLDTPCVIDLSLDMRRRTALQRTVEESKSFQDTLNGLVNVLRDGDGDEIDALLSHIRLNGDPADLATILQTKCGNRRDSKGTDSDMKLEIDGISDNEQEEEFLESSADFGRSAGLQRRRTMSLHGLEESNLFDRRQGKARAEGGDEDAFALKYLPLIERIKTTSAWEASRILHELSKSPVTENRISLSRFEKIQQRKTSHTLDSHYTAGAMDRRFWHPSLQLATEESSIRIELKGSNFPTPWIDGGTETLEESPLSPRSGDPALASKWNSGRKNTGVASPSEAYQRSKTLSSSGSEQIFGTSTFSKAMHTNSAGAIEIYGDLRSLTNGHSGQYDQGYQNYRAQGTATVPIYLIQPRLILEDSPLSRVYTGFRDGARAMIAAGTPASVIIGGLETVVDLFFRERRPDDAFTCSSWASELSRSFVEINEFVRLASVFQLTRLMRWLLVPTAETYAELPQLIRPTPIQCFVPHIPAIDLNVIPIMRDALCYRFFDWITPVAKFNMSVNWPYTMEEALERDPNSGIITVSQAFQQHVSLQENWSVNSYALAIFPEFEGKIRIEEVDDDMMKGMISTDAVR